MLSSFALGAAFAALSPEANLAQQAQPTVEELKRVVEQKEKELHAAQAALAVARARLAQAEGKVELAAAEWRMVLSHYEGRLKVVQDLIKQGRLCSDEPLRQAEGSVAVAHAWLADAEGKRDDLLAALPNVIAYYDWRIQRYQSLRQHRAIPEEVAQEALKESDTELRWARERLAGLRGNSASQNKGSKP
jgi:hypothetical protein